MIYSLLFVIESKQHISKVENIILSVKGSVLGITPTLPGLLLYYKMVVFEVEML